MSVSLELRALRWAIPVVVVALVAGGIYWRGKNDADFSNVKAQVRTTEQSAEISRETADTVAADQTELWRQAQADEDYIDARIRTLPAGEFAPADPDILRIAREAHARALCAAGRVQRESSSDDSTCAAR